MKQHLAAAVVAASTILPVVPGAAQARHVGAQHPHPHPHPHPRAQRRPHADATAWMGQTGIASYYGPAHQGRRSASGRRFDQRELTAAHPWLPFGTRVKVTLAGTSRSVVVTITDRLYSQDRIVDLSLAAARQLGMVHRGVAEVMLAPA